MTTTTQTPAEAAGNKSGTIVPPGNMSSAVLQTIHDNPGTEDTFGYNFDGAKQVTDPRKKTLPAAVSAAVVSPHFASNTVQGPASLVELARALNIGSSPVQNMYEWVYSNIDWEPGWGVQKGALGAILDGVGNAFDQSLLLANLLRQAGFTANIIMGTIRLTEAQYQAWWGVKDIWTAQAYCGNLFIPIVTAPTWTGTTYYMDIKHVWVAWVNGATTYYFDPCMKSYTRTTGRSDLATILGYNATTFMSDAQSGASVTTDYAQNMNRTNIRNDLKTFTGNLVTWINANKPDAQVDDLIGGQTINAPTLPLLQTTLPYEAPGDVPTVWTGDVPAAFKPTIQVQFPNWSTPGVWDFTWSTTSDQLAATRLTLFYDTSLVPHLYLNGTAVANGLAQPSGSYSSIFITVTHPAYAASNYPMTWQQSYQTNFQWWQGSIYAGQNYLIGNAWGNLGRGQMDYHQTQVDANVAAGGSATSEAVLGEKLAVTFFRWAGQNSRVTDMINRIKSCKSVYSHQVGVIGYNNASTAFTSTDLGGVSGSSQNFNNDVTQTPINDTVVAMHGVALEAATLAQMTGNGPGISTTTVIDAASAAGNKIYKGTSSNWNTGSSISATLVANGYSSTDMTNLYNWYIQYGNSVVLGDHPGTAVGGVWTGWGYWNYPSSGGFGIINGTFKGGGDTGSPDNKDKNKNNPGIEFVEPIGMANGSYLLRNEDLDIGSGEFPYRLGFGRVYNSTSQYLAKTLGRGWTHSHDITASVSSNGFLALGEQYAVPASATIAEIFVMADIISDTSRPVAKLVTMSLADAWWVEQLYSNSVVIAYPDRNQIFVKQPDGSYSAPINFPNKLTLSGGLYTLTTPQGVKTNFNASGQISTIVFPNGVTVTYSYTGGLLTGISNGLGRNLTLSYTAGVLTSVSDGTGRSASYTVDSNPNLTKFTDANGKNTTFSYDLPGRLTAFFNPAFPATAFITNTYDSLSRVKTQANARGQVTNLYFAGSRVTTVDSVGNNLVWYLNKFGSITRQIDPFGYEIDTTYDGLNRQVKMVYPEGNQTLWTWDANNNPLTITQVPKPGSGLSNVVDTFTYDSTWAKLKTYKDKNNNTTTYTYDATLGNLLTIRERCRNTILDQIRQSLLDVLVR